MCYFAERKAKLLWITARNISDRMFYKKDVNAGGYAVAEKQRLKKAG
jgi:hypothetical protein